MSRKIKITFCSGTQEVTGSNFLFDTHATGLGQAGKRILIDCGLIQSSKMAEDDNWDPFIYDPKTIDYLFVTHAHIDHIGRIPKLINDGFNGKIYSTPPTKEITKYMLDDTAHILDRDKEHGLDKIYSEDNIKKAFDIWDVLDYHQKITIDGIEVELLDSGHILGSAMILFKYNGTKTLFTGDLGNSPSPLLPDTEIVNDINYLIMESVYGDRIHEDKKERKDKLEDAIENNVKKRGVLLIPTFSLERSQELLFEIDSMIENNQIPLVPVLFDSPLAIKLTEVYKKYSDYFKKEVRLLIKEGGDIFMFPGLRNTPDVEQSKMITLIPKPKIIIAGSGMSSGGRIIHHEKMYLPDPNSTILLTGYQSPGTMGRRIEDGAKTVKIAGEEVSVQAEVRMIGGYSGHKDSNALLDFVQDTSETIKKVFVVMGEPKASLFLVQKLRDSLGIDVRAPEKGETVEIEI